MFLMSLDGVRYDKNILSPESKYLEYLVIIESVKRVGSVPEYYISPQHSPQSIVYQSSHFMFGVIRHF